MAKQNTEALFEESSEGAVSAVTAVVFVLSMVLAFGGLIAASYSFSDSFYGVSGFLLFGGGLLASVLGFALPFTILPATRK